MSKELLHSLLTWLSTFETEGAQALVGDLTDGVAMSEVFYQIAPSWFGPDGLAKIKRDVGNSKPLKVSNIKKLKRGLLEFYEAELQLAASQLNVPADNDVAEGDVDAMIAMLELLLGCAVQCTDKAVHISKIMALERAEVKQNLMASIQRLLENTSLAAQPSNDSFHNPDLVAANEEMAHKLKSKEREYAALLEQYNKAQEEITELKEKSPAPVNAGIEDAFADEIHQLKMQLNSAKENLAHAQGEHEEEIKSRNKEIKELRRSLERAEDDASAGMRLRDEVEELRQDASKIPGLEKRVESYKQKLQEYAETIKQAKGLEEQSSSQMKRIIQLEEAEKNVGKLESRITSYKQQLDELEENLKEESLRSERLKLERNKHEEANLRLAKENRELQQQLSMSTADSRDSSIAGLESLGDIMDQSAREKMMRLEHENELLRAKGGTDDDKHYLYEELAAKKAKLDRENTELSRKIIGLESELSDLRKTVAQSSVQTTGDLVIQKLAAAERDLSQANQKLAQMEALKAQLQTTTDRLKETQEELITLQTTHSLTSMDQKDLIDKIKQSAVEEAAKEIEKLKEQVQALNSTIEELKAKTATLTADNERLTSTLEQTTKEKDDLDERLKDRTEEIAHILKEKGDLQTKLLALRESREIAASSRSDGSDLSEKIHAIEKKHMAEVANLEREKLQEIHEKDSEFNKQLSEKDATIRKLEGDIKHRDEKIQRLKKAAVKGLADSASASSDEAVRALKQQVAELQAKYDAEKHNRESMKEQHEREMKLIVTAWYDLAFQHQRAAVMDNDRQPSAGSGVSFLSKQRHSALNRPNDS